MNTFYQALERHKKPIGIICAIYLIFDGFAIFPLNIHKDFFSMDVISYLLIGFCLVGVIKARPLRVWLLCCGCSAVGMLCRFAIEFGEISNTVNFTPTNILIFLLAIPSFCTIVYLLGSKLRAAAEAETPADERQEPKKLKRPKK